MRKLIGHVNVDAGMVMVGDPCYLTRWKINRDTMDIGEGRPGPYTYTYEGACNGSMNSDQGAELGNGDAIVVRSGYGDGTYPAFVEYTDGKDGWGRRVKCLIVEFVSDDADEDDDEV